MQTNGQEHTHSLSRARAHGGGIVLLLTTPHGLRLDTTRYSVPSPKAVKPPLPALDRTAPSTLEG